MNINVIAQRVSAPDHKLTASFVRRAPVVASLLSPPRLSKPAVNLGPVTSTLGAHERIHLTFKDLPIIGCMKMSRKFKMVDFFAGSGLVSKGFEKVCKSIWANDIDETKAKIFKANHGNHIVIEDIKSLLASNIPSADLMWGSFPCQDLSLAGNFTGINGERSGLVWQWLRLLESSSDRPKIVIAENVKGLLSSNGGNDYVSLHEGIENLGYIVGYVILDAIHWLPQSRPRIFVVGIQEKFFDTKLTVSEPGWCHGELAEFFKNRLPKLVFWNLPFPHSKRTELSQIIDKSTPVSSEFSKSAIKLIGKDHFDKLNTILETSPDMVFPGYRRTRNGKQKLELRFDNVSGCLRTAKGGSSKQIVVYRNNKGGIVARFLTPLEAARLMGAPQDYKFPVSENDIYTAMGDAVAVPVVEFLANNLVKRMLLNAG